MSQEQILHAHIVGKNAGTPFEAPCHTTSSADRAVHEILLKHCAMSDGNGGGRRYFKIFMLRNFSQKNGMGDLGGGRPYGILQTFGKLSKVSPHNFHVTSMLLSIKVL